ncbi:MAG: hypothetical protein ACXVRZ_18675, partial [Gaiellaceae bacterium]
GGRRRERQHCRKECQKHCGSHGSPFLDLNRSKLRLKSTLFIRGNAEREKPRVERLPFDVVAKPFAT